MLRYLPWSYSSGPLVRTAGLPSVTAAGSSTIGSLCTAGGSATRGRTDVTSGMPSGLATSRAPDCVASRGPLLVAVVVSRAPDVLGVGVALLVIGDVVVGGPRFISAPPVCVAGFFFPYHKGKTRLIRSYEGCTVASKRLENTARPSLKRKTIK